MKSGNLILDDSTLEKPYSEFNALVYRHWLGKQKEVVNGINLIRLLWTDEHGVSRLIIPSFPKTATAKQKTIILPG